LLNLVNQLLDFRKMEFKELKLSLKKGEIVEFIKEVSCSFNDLADQNHIAYLFESEVPALVTKFDHDKIERILFNLLSNAFKFTPAGGHISVLLRLIDTVKADDDTQLLEIKVVDTGIGISEEKQEKIFERFFQVNMPENLLNQGSGIGLSISHEFVKMHGGEIFVESEPGNGSTFIVRLPLNVEDEKYIPAAPVNKPVHSVLKPTYVHDSEKKPAVLLVEDNDDLRFYLKDNLKHIFNIIEAVNGKEGWQKALALHPNLIVSDITMPEMNGIELCKKVREDSRTTHIPVILLTALTEEEDQLTGLANGANDYITKPFNFEILLSKINSLLLMQQTLKKTYQKQKEIQVQDLEIVSEDEKFLKSAFDCIEKNITNYNFSVEELSRQMALSRVSLYKRMLALTGKTPVDCIRTVRLKRAVQLLEKSQLSIANIAYEVGFNNPTYFSKVFKDEYGTVPSEYVIAFRNKEKETEEIQ
jgi:DNA-binding response OmpR family regulator